MASQLDYFRKLTKGIKVDKTRFQPQLERLGLQSSASAKPTTNSSVCKEEDNEESENECGDGAENVPKKAEGSKVWQHKIKIKRVRKENNIRVRGSDIPDPITDFAQLETQHGVSSVLVQNLRSQGYTEPTPIQMQCWPLMLGGRELLASAPTGSGKTAAFLLPIIHQLGRPRALGFRAVIVAPTRELADQTFRECEFLARGTGLKVHVIDKVDKIAKKFGPKSSQKFDILVTTPNRLVYMINSDEPLIKLDNVEWLIMDECDHLFEGGRRGFREQLAQIYQACAGPKLQRGLFSATHSAPLQQWCLDNLNCVALLNVGAKNSASEDVAQELVFCGDENGKIYALRNLLAKGFEPPCLVFVQTKERARQLFMELVYDDVMVDAIHGDRTQAQREACVRAFRAKKIWVLVCTELMSRGIDFKGVNLVINYDFPPSLVSYVHRIGRTGRAQHKGKAVTFWTMADRPMLGIIARTVRASGSAVPDWMLAIKKADMTKQELAALQQDRGFVSEGAKFDAVDKDKKLQWRLKKRLQKLQEAGKVNTEQAETLRQELAEVKQRLQQVEDAEIKDFNKAEGKKRHRNAKTIERVKRLKTAK
ncbi:probable ATP-dependent RNA helicase DDX52, partial [Hyalella azteca]|uniref:Probable ATP-dependent RNA helicase DDX52 n=1 Tax=Hyalella azteca TaxID=294128 RepID=A0A8B7P327_HYAAZ